MTNVLNLYLDDSGTRHPTRAPGKRPEHGYDWFALGGILIRSEEEEVARTLHAEFGKRWRLTAPLHSSEIRSQNEGFLWLRGMDKDEQNRFYEELYVLMKTAPVVGIACVVDRPGYNQRYYEKYQKEPWSLCKTAFSVVVERAAKHARESGYRLRVAPERCNKAEDRMIRSYYERLKLDGMPFANDPSSKYGPLTPDQFQETLYELRFKAKTSPMAQLADLYLWPLCMGGYHRSNRPYARLMSDGKLLECHLPEEAWPMLATKYSCFDLVDRKS